MPDTITLQVLDSCFYYIPFDLFMLRFNCSIITIF